MEFAIDPSGQRARAVKGVEGRCPACLDPLTAKATSSRLVVPHWAHRGRRDCDPWWEPETDWHRGWKERLGTPEQREVVVGCHRADVCLPGLVIELQHSSISPDEIEERERYYTEHVGRMKWLLDGREWGVSARPFCEHSEAREKHERDFIEYLRGVETFKKWGGARPTTPAKRPPPTDLACPNCRRIADAENKVKCGGLHLRDGENLLHTDSPPHSVGRLGGASTWAFYGDRPLIVGDRLRLTWKHARRSFSFAKCPIAVDFGRYLLSFDWIGWDSPVRVRATVKAVLVEDVQP